MTRITSSDAEMPLISIRLAAGRDGETLSRLVVKVSETTSEALDVPIERGWPPHLRARR